MVKEEKYKILLYKIVLYLTKILPIVMSIMYASNTILSYFGIDWTIFSYIASNSILTILYLYCTSYAFKFCKYHRMFIHYIVVNDCVTMYDHEIGIPVDYRELFGINIFIIFCFILITLILYLHAKNNKKTTTSNNK